MFFRDGLQATHFSRALFQRTRESRSVTHSTLTRPPGGGRPLPEGEGQQGL